MSPHRDLQLVGDDARDRADAAAGREDDASGGGSGSRREVTGGQGAGTHGEAAAGSRGSTDSGDLPGNARCPFCGGHDTAPLATFGSLLMTSQYHCRRCRSTFELVRDEGG